MAFRVDLIRFALCVVVKARWTTRKYQVRFENCLNYKASENLVNNKTGKREKRVEEDIPRPLAHISRVIEVLVVHVFAESTG